MTITKEDIDERNENMIELLKRGNEMNEFVTRPLLKRVLEGEDVDVVFSKESVSDQCEKLLKMRRSMETKTKMSAERQQVIRDFHDYLEELTLEDICWESEWQGHRLDGSDEFEIRLSRISKMTDVISSLHDASVSQDIRSTIFNYMKQLAFKD